MKLHFVFLFLLPILDGALLRPASQRWQQAVQHTAVTPTPSISPPPAPGFYPDSTYKPIRTILLSDNEAEYTVQFTLILPSHAKVVNINHQVNASDIITSSTNHHIDHTGRYLAKNFTLTHRFEGDVGVVSYMLTVEAKIKSKTETYSVSGVYVVSGIVLKDEKDPDLIVSGIDSRGVELHTKKQLDAVYKKGYIALPVNFGALGPDITKSPVPYRNVVKGSVITVEPAVISVTGKVSAQSSLIQFGPSCNPYPHAMQGANGVVKFSKANCGVAFDDKSMKLYIRIIPKVYESAIIKIYLPSMVVDAEAFQTDIKVTVKKPQYPPPLLLLQRPLHLILDHFGGERLFLNMSNTQRPEQESDATEYYLTLPSNRYAIIMPQESVLTHPVQHIKFRVVGHGDEDAGIQEEISQALASYQKQKRVRANPRVIVPHGSTNSHMKGMENGSTLVPHGTMKSGDTPVVVRTITKVLQKNESDSQVWELSWDTSNFPRLMAGDKVTPTPTPTPSAAHRASPSLHSEVLVGFAKKKLLVVAINPTTYALTTKFASDKLAVVRELVMDYERFDVVVDMRLKGYGKGNFSEHKAQQIAGALAKRVDAEYELDDDDEKSKTYLIGLEESAEGLLLKYVSQIGKGDVGEIRDRISGKKHEISQELSKEAYLDAKALRITSTSVTIRQNSAQNAAEAGVSGISGGLVAAIVGLIAIILLPMVAFCFGYVVLRRHENDSSDDSDDDREQGEEEVESSGNFVTPRVEADRYGRADESNFESFKMEKEMFDQGYYESQDKSTS